MDSHTIFYFLVLFLGGILKEYAKCSPFPDLLISEVNADTPKIPETTEYIELWNTGNCPVSLDGYLISLFSGDQQSSPPYDNVDLSNHCIPGNGFFLIGPETLASLPNVVVNKKDFIQNGNGEAEAIALYKGKFGVAPTTLTLDNDLVDVIVYDRISLTDTSAFMPPLPSQPAVFEDGSWNDSGDESMNRCSNSSKTMSAFTVRELSPGSPSSCVPDLVTRWPSPYSNTAFSEPKTGRWFQYKTTHDVMATSAAISTLTVDSVTECSVHCSKNNLCTHFGVKTQAGTTFSCTLHNYCKTEVNVYLGGIVGEKYYKMSPQNPHWPHEALI